MNLFQGISNYFADYRRRRMAVVIAKDVIAQINLERYRAETDAYVLSHELDSIIAIADPKRQVQGCLLGLSKPCQVCAMGSVLLSGIRKYNNITVDNFSVETEHLPLEYMERFFSLRDLRAMEVAFERYAHTWSYSDLTDEDRDAAWEYGHNLSDHPNERLIEIMENVIRNKGRFVVPMTPVIVESDEDD